MSSHPIEALMKTTLESIKQMVDVNTIVGDPVETPDGTTIIPISKVTFGFASGGGEYHSNPCQDEQGEYPFAGGTGAGVSVKPVAFMIVNRNDMKLLSVQENANMLDSIFGFSVKLIDKIQDSFREHRREREEHEHDYDHEYEDEIIIDIENDIDED